MVEYDIDLVTKPDSTNFKAHKVVKKLLAIKIRGVARYPPFTKLLGITKITIAQYPFIKAK